MGEEDGLGALKMGVPGEHRGLLASCEFDQCRDHRLELSDSVVKGLHRPEPKIRRHLVVPTPAGMEFLAEIADSRDEFTFHEGVNVFVVGVDQDGGRLGDTPGQILEGLFDLDSFAGLKHLGVFERSCPRRGPRDILQKETAIEGK
jgi:hypothetical protein